MRVETNVDLCSDPFHIIDDIVNDEIPPPQDREEFLNWYLARRLEDSNGMSSRDVQAAMRDAEDVWRFISWDRGFTELEFPMRPERTERDRLWSRTYINALARRKGNAVVAVTIRC
jgi:hypothetical protein